MRPAGGGRFRPDAGPVWITGASSGIGRALARRPMPFLMDAERAAERIQRGLQGGAFEIAFPYRFALLLKALNLLPHGWYFAAVHRLTGR